MPVTKKFTDWAVVLDADTAQGGAAVYIAGIRDMSLASNIVVGRAKGNESVYRTHGSIRSGAPIARFSTPDIVDLMGESSIEGMLIDAGDDGDGIILFEPRRKSGGTVEAADSSLHNKRTIANGMFTPSGIEVASPDDLAIITAEIQAIQSGAVAPVTFNETADLPAGVYPTVDATFGMGKVDLNGTELDGKQSMNISFENPMTPDKGDNDIYPTHVSIEDINPVISIVTRHADLTSVLTEDGAFYTASQVIVYLQKRAEGGSFVAVGTAEHVKMTIGKCFVIWDDLAGDPKNMTVSIFPWRTPGGSPVEPITFNLASAIT